MPPQSRQCTVHTRVQKRCWNVWEGRTGDKCERNSAYPSPHYSCSDNRCFARANTDICCCLIPLKSTRLSPLTSWDYIWWSHRIIQYGRGFTCHDFIYNARDFTYNEKMGSSDSELWYCGTYSDRTPHSVAQQCERSKIFVQNQTVIPILTLVLSICLVCLLFSWLWWA